jgi:hypothetical protein
VRECTIESPPHFRKSLGIASTPRAISNPEHIIDPSNKEKRIEDNDDISKCVSSHFSRIGKDSTVNPIFWPSSLSRGLCLL